MGFFAEVLEPAKPLLSPRQETQICFSQICLIFILCARKCLNPRSQIKIAPLRSEELIKMNANQKTQTSKNQSFFKQKLVQIVKTENGWILKTFPTTFKIVPDATWLLPQDLTITTNTSGQWQTSNANHHKTHQPKETIEWQAWFNRDEIHGKSTPIFQNHDYCKLCLNAYFTPEELERKQENMQTVKYGDSCPYPRPNPCNQCELNTKDNQWNFAPTPKPQKQTTFKLLIKLITSQRQRNRQTARRTCLS